jgi:tetraacyldisaccharide 4'-kinase
MAFVRTYVENLMRDRREGLADKIAKFFLWLISLVYGMAVSVVDMFYRKGLRRVYKVPVPVISVGNLTLGGTGKTPFTIFIADHLVSAGRKPAILMRGYGGDEDRMIRDELPDVPVYASQNRVKSARRASRKGCDSVILDDGFQHRRIARDLNILLIDGVSVFGNGYLFPRGVLREKVKSVSRADMFVITKVDRIDEERRAGILRLLSDIAPGKPVIMSRHRPTSLSDVTGAAFSPDSISARNVCLLSGIADPDYLDFLVSGLGADIKVRFDYGDHNSYNQKQINTVVRECARRRVKTVITTKKDYVKIRDLDISAIEDKILILNVAIEVLQGKESLFAGLDSVFNGKRA